MHEWELVAGLAALLLLAVGALLKGLAGKPAKLPYFSRGCLLSPGEAAFYHALRQALPKGAGLAPKVRICDILDCDSAARRNGFWNKISQKHVDFVLINVETTAFLMIIELDDKTHDQRDRRERDEFVDRAFAAAGIQIMHVKAAGRYSVPELRSSVMARLAARS